MVIPSHDIGFLKADYQRFSSYCVYAWKRKDEWLYIGSTKHGLKRAFAHGVIGVAEEMQDTDEVLIWSCESYFAAQAMEVELILACTPKHNKQQDMERLFGSLFGKDKRRK